MPSRITIVGLGPGDLMTDDRGVAAAMRADAIVARTIRHPAVEQLAAHVSNDGRFVACDDLYEAATFEDVYDAIADRVLEMEGHVAYAVPGSPLVAERSVGVIRRRAEEAGVGIDIVAAPSFIDELCVALDFDPAARGMQLLDGRDLPDPIVLQLPTIVFHVDVPIVLSDVIDRLAKTIPDDVAITVVSDLGTEEARVVTLPIGEVDASMAGLRTSLFVDVEPVGLLGAVSAMRRLRSECPWDREQTHDSLVPYVLEEAHELVDAIAHLPPGAPEGTPDFGAYAEVEDELGDVLLQVLFHSTLAAETGAFDIDDVAEQLRRKLVRRHPHVFADVAANDIGEVEANWEAIKASERSRDSHMDGVATGLPALERAWKVQTRAARAAFDWPDVDGVLAQLDAEVRELSEAVAPHDRADELGDVLFTAVNVARHVGIDPELALRRATAKFEARFRVLETLADRPLAELSEAEAQALWDRAKATVSGADLG